MGVEECVCVRIMAVLLLGDPWGVLLSIYERERDERERGDGI